MTQILLDSVLRSKLQNLSGPLELCDESGNILARVIPVLDPSLYEREDQLVSAAELQRRREEPDFSTAEVFASLAKL
jgi:hypothetical protein